MSGRDGRVLWSAPTTRGGFALTPSSAGKALADFNGDHVLDLALWTPASPTNSGQGPLRLNVVDGRTGQPLWPAPAVAVSHPDRLVWPEPAVADLDGDGVPEVLVTRHGGYESRKGYYHCELLAVDGRDGQVRWTWSWRSGFPQIWPPLVLKSGNAGQALVCLVVQTNNVSTLVALDTDGQERARRRLTLPRTQFDSGRLVWRSFDVDGDARDELLFLDDGKLCAAGGEALEVRWRWALPNDAVCLADVRASAPGLPATLTVWTGQDAYGLDGATGRPLWRCGVNNIPLYGGSDVPEARRLAAPVPALPRVQRIASPRSAYSPSSVVRQAWPVADTGRYLAPKPAPGTFTPVKAITMPQRRLPWVDDDMAVVLSGGIALLVAGIPILLAGWAVRRRSWLLGLLPLCYAGLSLLLPWRAMIPAVIMLGYAVWLGLWAGRSRRWLVLSAALVYAGLSAVVVLTSLAPKSSLDGPNWLRALQMTMVGVPGLAFWAMCGWALMKRRWATLGWLFGVSVFVALLAAGLLLWSDLPNRAPDETYSWRGFYFIWFAGVTVAGLAGLVVLGGRKFVQWIRRHRPWKSTEATAA